MRRSSDFVLHPVIHAEQIHPERVSKIPDFSYLRIMEKIISKFEVVVNGEHFEVSSLEEAERKVRNYIKMEAEAFICRKDFTPKGKLIEIYYVG